MKIISKYKDYYDFAMGHDVDSRKVYVREFSVLGNELFDRIKINDSFLTDAKLSRYGSRYLTWRDMRALGKLLASEYISGNDGLRYDFNILCVCGKAYQMLEIETNLFDLNKDKEIYLCNDIPMDYVYNVLQWDNSHIDKVLDPKNKSYGTERKSLSFIPIPAITNANDLVGAPVIKIKYGGIHVNPCLSDFKFGSIIPPLDMYNEIYNWIKYTEPITDSDPTDMNRYESKGFDKKTSFRKM